MEKKKQYQYKLSDWNAFQILYNFWNLCEHRLFELIEEYPHLIVGTEWNKHLWIQQKQKMKQAIIQNLKKK